MPELPEVETVVRGLRKTLEGRLIEKVELFFTGMIRDSTPDIFAATVKGSTVAKVNRRGKYILLQLHKNQQTFTLAVHLRMTGRLIFCPDRIQTVNPYTRAVFYLQDSGCLLFADIRKFGTFNLVFDKDEAKFLNCLGVEPLAPAFSLEQLEELTARASKSPVKNFLLNQKYICGIGNIYADEILFKALLHPQRLLSSLSENEIKRLYNSILQILQEGIDKGGTSIRDYRNALGKKGGYQKHLKIYRRAGNKCPRCGTFIKKTKVGGRGTYYCPLCQQS